MKKLKVFFTTLLFILSATPVIAAYTLSQGGTGNTGFSSSTLAISDGSKLYGFATSSLGLQTSLPIGTSGQILALFGTTPTWVASTTFSSPLLYSAGNVTCQTASTINAGCLSAASFNVFNGKQAAGNYITALTGDVTASGPGSVAATLATVNSNIGSFTNGSFTVNGKGLVTAASSGVAPVTSVDVSGGTTGLTTSGGPITTSGVITLAGTLGLANGGTNNTSFGSSTFAASNGSKLYGYATSSLGIALSDTTGTLAVLRGGTGKTSFASSSLLISDGTNIYGFATSSLFQISTDANSGLLSAADHATFNGKQAAGNYITALTGDVTASGPGSVAATLATVNGNVGSFTNGSFTVNGKGLITAASSGAAPVTSVTGSWPIISSGGATPNITFGGLSTTSPWTIGNAAYVTGNGTIGSTATTTASCSGTVSCTGFTIFGASPITITGSGGSSFGQAWEIGGNGLTGFLAPTTTQKVWIGQASSTIFSANQAQIGGSATSTFTSDGKIGIGTTTPFAMLAINPVAGNGNSFVVGSSSATSFVINNAGNVGIGKTSPTSALDVNGLGTFSDGSQGLVIGSATQFPGTLTGAIWNSTLVPDTTNYAFTASQVQTIVNATSRVLIAVGGNEMARINTSGNLGINDIAPGTKLSVVGNGAFGYASGQTAPTNGLVVKGNSGIGTTSPWGAFGVNPIAGDKNQFVVGSSSATSFLITPNGNVGIATTSPGSLFSIGNTSGINFAPSATSTFSGTGGGINIASGCYAVSGTCLTASGGGQLLGIFSTSTPNGTASSTVVFTGAANSQPSFSANVLTLPSNTAYFIVEIWGGGGGGGGAAANGAAPGGGSSSYSEKLYSPIASQYYYNVGPGGTGGAAGANAGKVGVYTVFGNGLATTTANPGNGGVGAAAQAYQAGATGGSTSGSLGDINIAGAKSGVADVNIAANIYIVGYGAAAPNGGAGGGAFLATAGTNGDPFGGGGGGGADNAGAAKAGGNGGSGGLNIYVYTTGISNGSLASGLAGQFPYYAADGTNLSATSALFLSGVALGIGSTTPWGKFAVNPVAGDLNQFVVGSSTATSFIINPAGFVGIATTTPAFKFDVNGPILMEPIASPTLGGYKGVLWNDLTQNQLAYSNGNTLYQGGNLYTATADVTINSASPTSAFSGTKVGTTVIAANSLKVGQKLTIWGAGYYSTPIGNTSTVTITTSVASSTVTTISTVTTGAFPATATNLPFDFILNCTIRSTGAQGTLVCDGSFNYATALSAVAKTSNSLSTVSTIKFDTTVAETLDVKANWSAVTTQTATVQEAKIDF